MGGMRSSMAPAAPMVTVVAPPHPWSRLGTGGSRACAGELTASTRRAGASRKHQALLHIIERSLPLAGASLAHSVASGQEIDGDGVPVGLAEGRLPTRR